MKGTCLLSGKEAFLDGVAPESRAEGWTGVRKAKSRGRQLSAERQWHSGKGSEVRLHQEGRMLTLGRRPDNREGGG